MRFHGASWNISPDKYRLNSGLCLVGSSHGVSSIKVQITPVEECREDVRTAGQDSEQDDSDAPDVDGFSLIRCIHVELGKK
jgi:hypothetical protein